MFALLLDDDLGTHVIGGSTASLSAGHLEGPGSGGGGPDVGGHAWHQIHLGPELWHIEAVQDVDRALQKLDRLVERQVQVVGFDHDIVLRVGIVWIQAQRVVGTDVLDIGRAEPAVFPRKAEAPVPLPADDLDLGRPLRDRDKLVPYEQTGRQHGPDAHRGPDGEPPLDLLVIRIVYRPCSLLVTEAEYAIGREQDDGGESDPGYPECDDDRVVDVFPVRGNRRPPPRAQNVKHD